MKISDELLEHYATSYVGQRKDITFEQYITLQETIKSLTIASARYLKEEEGVKFLK